jgi:hypothetical protein
MKPRRARSKRMHVMRLWLWSEVVGAIPYLRSIIGSVRDHWLALAFARRELDRIERLPGRATRSRMIDVQRLQHDREQAQAKFEDAMQELADLDVGLLDPVRGLAHIAFRKQDDLAWYVFDVFAKQGIIGWRYHSDPIELCRPLEPEKEISIPSKSPRKKAR